MKKIDISTPKYANTFVLVDDEDYEKVIQGNKWSVFKSGNNFYAKRMSDGKRNSSQLLHRLIAGESKNIRIDHKDGNGLNCQKHNLRLCTHAQNMQNTKTRKNKTSKYKGVNWSKRESKWLSRINYNCEHIHIGYFNNEEEAAMAYDKKAIELFGEFANINFKIEVIR